MITQTNLVLTENGYKTVEEIQIGDMVLCPTNPLGRSNQFNQVINKLNHGLQHTFLYEFDDGNFIECSMTQKFLGRNNQFYPIWYFDNHSLPIISRDNEARITNMTEYGRCPSFELVVDNPFHGIYINNLACLD